MACPFPYSAPELGLQNYKDLRHELEADYSTNFDLRGRRSGQPRRLLRSGGKYTTRLTINGPNVHLGIRFLEELCARMDLDLRHWPRPLILREAGSEARPQPQPEAVPPQDDEVEEVEGQKSDSDDETEPDWGDDEVEIEGERVATGHGSVQPFLGQARLPSTGEKEVGDRLVEVLRPLAFNLCQHMPDRQPHLESLSQNINIVDVTRNSEWVVAFCTTTFKRSWQLKFSLPWNLLTLYPHRAHAMLFVADLNGEEDTELTDFFRDHCQLAHELNYLHILSGSIPGWDASRAKNAVHFGALEFLEQAAASARGKVTVGVVAVFCC